MPPGRSLVLLTADGRALWATNWQRPEFQSWQPGLDCWVCTVFRNEGQYLSSLLVRQAVAATRAAFGEAPAGGFVTFVDSRRIRPKRDPGRCFRRAGWQVIGTTKRRGLVVLGLGVADMPEPEPPLGMQLQLPFGAEMARRPTWKAG